MTHLADETDGRGRRSSRRIGSPSASGRSPVAAAFFGLFAMWSAATPQIVSAQDPAAAPQRTVTVAVVQDGPYQRNQDLVDRLEDELVTLLSSDFTLAQPRLYEGDWTLAGIRDALDTALSDDEADVVIATGFISANLLSRRTEVSSPAVAAFILGPQILLPSQRQDTSGVANLNFVNANRSERSLELLAELAELGKVGIVVPAAAAPALPDLGTHVAELSGGLIDEADVLAVGSTVGDALEQIDDDVTSVLLLPLPQLSDAEWSRLVEGVNAQGLPSFSWLGESEVRDGVLAGATPEGFQQQLLRWTALNVQRILLGTEAATLRVSFPPQERLVINMRTADRIGVSPPWSLLVAAQLIDREERPADRRLSLQSAMQEARTMNLELAAAERFVAAGEDQVRLATAPLLPQIGIDAQYRGLDDTRAEAIPGFAARTFSGGASLRQLIFDETVWANRSIEGSLQDSREFDRDALQLDVTREAGVAYLNVLRAKTLERIQRDNLEVTATNLDFARLRVSAGAASLSEVFRWQAQLAGNQQNLVDSEVTRALTELEVNRLLNHPLEERFDTDEATLIDPPISDLLPLMEPFIDNPRDFEIFREFMTGEALEVSPEIGQLDALTSAQERLLQSANRSFFLPQVAFEAGLDHRFSESGVGADDLARLDQLTWNFALVFSYPLFAGTARFAARSQATQELARIELERDDVTQRIDQRMRSSLQLLRGSWVKIDLSRAAADAADNNFRLVQDAYRRGVGDILGVLDAQSQALTASEAAASAVYDFLIDLIEVERSVGRFEYFGSFDERDAFFQRLEEFYRQSLVRGN